MCRAWACSLEPGGAAAFFAQPAWELHDAHVPLDALWGDAAAAELHERLLAETTPAARFHQLERVLLARRAEFATPHPAVTYALAALRGNPQDRTVAQIVDQIALSHRQFIEVFRREVGMTPKRFCRLRRFLRVVHQTAWTNEVHWAEMALACGYADQAHLAREFHEFAGISATTYLHHRHASNPSYILYVSSAGDDTTSTHRAADLHASAG